MKAQSLLSRLHGLQAAQQMMSARHMWEQPELLALPAWASQALLGPQDSQVPPHTFGFLQPLRAQHASHWTTCMLSGSEPDDETDES